MAIEQASGRSEKGQRLWILFPLLFVFSLIALFCFLESSGSAPHDIVSKVPLGIHVSELEPYLIRGRGSTGEVTEWTEKTTEPYTGRVPMKNTKWGKFKTNSLGDYDAWKKTVGEGSRFTGDICFIHSSIWSADVNCFYFKDGKLIDKDWGFLPG